MLLQVGPANVHFFDIATRCAAECQLRGQKQPPTFPAGTAGLAPIADVPGGGRGEGYGPHSDPPITPPVRPVSIRLRKRRRATRVGSAAPASPMCHNSAVDALAAGPGGPPRSGRPFRAHPRRCGGRSRGIALRAEKRGKAPACAWSWKDAGSATRRFESSRPSQRIILK